MEIDKLIQLTNYLLKKYDFSLNYTKLIKELYLADRECIKKTGWSISDDLYKNLPYGPVLVNLYSLIQGKHPDVRMQSKWDSNFLTDSKDLKAKVSIIPDGELSQMEKNILDEIDQQYHSYSYSKMIDVVHNKNICPEWKDPHGSSSPLTKEDIMRSIGFDEDSIKHFAEEERTYNYEKELLAHLEDF
ncbi:Panacea domain-containing protein [Treponema bryantii]|uniref:Panacea domain-containing protein n=1 Tax=Treponema bryantii TaxID=163 RepID=UPI0003B4205A|nr:Panacea domain-containing protein [Treponema bryantii]